jgi:UDP-N-acetylglucosamine pyrophosphorylase
MYICPVPTIVASETLYYVAPDSTQTFNLSVTVPAWYPSGRGFLFTAVVSEGYSYVDSGSVVVFQQ